MDIENVLIKTKENYAENDSTHKCAHDEILNVLKEPNTTTCYRIFYIIIQSNPMIIQLIYYFSRDHSKTQNKLITITSHDVQAMVGADGSKFCR